jgi:hypothetical protein
MVRQHERWLFLPGVRLSSHTYRGMRIDGQRVQTWPSQHGPERDVGYPKAQQDEPPRKGFSARMPPQGGGAEE